jgi:hypothetical protein
MDHINTLNQLLGTFPGTTDDILKYKCAIVTTVYSLVRPTFNELTAAIRDQATKFGLDVSDPKFDRNIVYCVAILRTEKIIKRVSLYDEDIFLVEDVLRPVLARILDPTHSIDMMNASIEPTEASSSLNQSILLDRPASPQPVSENLAAGPPAKPQCVLV